MLCEIKIDNLNSTRRNLVYAQYRRCFNWKSEFNCCRQHALPRDSICVKIRSSSSSSSMQRSTQVRTRVCSDVIANYLAASSAWRVALSVQWNHPVHGGPFPHDNLCLSLSMSPCTVATCWPKTREKLIRDKILYNRVLLSAGVRRRRCILDRVLTWSTAIRQTWV